MTLTVATYNLYQGASLIPAYGAGTLTGMAGALRQEYQQMAKTDFPARAAAIADHLAAHQPDVVGLQEVARWQDGDEVCDFLDVLLAELARTGRPYRAVATAITSSLALHTDGDIVGMTDRVALLARTGGPAPRFTVGPTGQQIYTARIELPAPSGLVLSKLRGFAWADGHVGDRPLRIVTTHLEAFDSGLRLAQARELVETLDAHRAPVVVVGDFNATPEDDAYALFAERGFRDAWTDAHPGDPGPTGLQSSTLDNAESTLSQRFDYILHRGPELAVTSAARLGADPASRLSSGHWASDHAGLVATLT